MENNKRNIASFWLRSMIFVRNASHFQKIFLVLGGRENALFILVNITFFLFNTMN
jgi:hypothetical protein